MIHDTHFIRGSVLSLSYVFTNPREDSRKKKRKEKRVGLGSGLGLVFVLGLVCGSTWLAVGGYAISSDTSRLTAYVGVGVGSAYSERMLRSTM